jgi:hypothetical protein
MADPTKSRDRVLTTLAVLMGIMALSNISKPIAQAMSPESSAGFVFFGQRLQGNANAIIGPLFGVFLGTYAYGVWTMQRWVLPVAFAYAAYVLLNLMLFATDPPPDSGGPIFGAIYALVAIGVSAGGAWYLNKNSHLLH